MNRGMNIIMTDQIIKTDKPYRKKLFTTYAIAIIVLVLFFWLVLPQCKAHLYTLPIMDFLLTTEIAVIIFLLLFIAPAVYLIRFGQKVLAHNQFPYPGQKVIHDTKVVTGKKAVSFGRMLIFLGILSLFMSVTGIVVSHVYFEKFRHFDPFHASSRVA
jgi:hypothetical protein